MIERLLRAPSEPPAAFFALPSTTVASLTRKGLRANFTQDRERGSELGGGRIIRANRSHKANWLRMGCALPVCAAYKTMRIDPTENMSG